MTLKLTHRALISLSFSAFFYCLSVFVWDGFYFSLYFLITSKFSIHLALGRSSCTIGVSRPTVWNPSSLLQFFITLVQQKSSLGAAVLNSFLGCAWQRCCFLCSACVQYLSWGKPTQKYGSFTAQQSSGWSLGFDYLLWLLRCSASFWVTIGIKQDISYCHVMWQLVWVTCTNGGWKQNCYAGGIAHVLRRMRVI